MSAPWSAAAWGAEARGRRAQLMGTMACTCNALERAHSQRWSHLLAAPPLTLTQLSMSMWRTLGRQGWEPREEPRTWEDTHTVSLCLFTLGCPAARSSSPLPLTSLPEVLAPLQGKQGGRGGLGWVLAGSPDCVHTGRALRGRRRGSSSSGRQPCREAGAFKLTCCSPAWSLLLLRSHPCPCSRSRSRCCCWRGCCSAAQAPHPHLHPRRWGCLRPMHGGCSAWARHQGSTLSATNARRVQCLGAPSRQYINTGMPLGRPNLHLHPESPFGRVGA